MQLVAEGVYCSPQYCRFPPVDPAVKIRYGKLFRQPHPVLRQGNASYNVAPADFSNVPVQRMLYKPPPPRIRKIIVAINFEQHIAHVRLTATQKFPALVEGKYKDDVGSCSTASETDDKDLYQMP